MLSDTVTGCVCIKVGSWLGSSHAIALLPLPTHMGLLIGLVFGLVSIFKDLCIIIEVKANSEHLAVFLIGFVVAKDAIFACFTFVAKKSNTCVQEPSLNSFS